MARRTAVTLIGSYVALSTSTGSCISDARLGKIGLWDLLSAGSRDPGAAGQPASGAYRPRKSRDFGRFALIALPEFTNLSYRLPLSGAGGGFLIDRWSNDRLGSRRKQ